jgi:hypothetical protein
MKPGMTISCVAHAAALGFAVIAISAQPMEAPPVDSLMTQIISEKDFSQMTKGVKNAPQLKLPEPKPLADKVGEEKSVDQLAPKVVDKPAITTQTSAKAEPKPDQPKADPKTAAKADPKPPDPAPDPKPDAKADPKPDPTPDQKQAEKPKPPEYKPDQIADLLKKDAAKEAKTNDKPVQQKQNAPKFDANQIAHYLDQRAPQRQLAAASQVNDTATLGMATASQEAQLEQSEFGALQACLKQQWSAPPGVDANTTKINVVLRVLLRQDGSIAAPPVILDLSDSLTPLQLAVVTSARHAIDRCQPFTMLKPEHYKDWRVLDLNFDPRLMVD